MNELADIWQLIQAWWQGQGQTTAGQVSTGVSQALGHLDTTSLLALAGVLGWASGFRLYMVVFIMGSIGALNWIELPNGLQTLSHPAVMSVSGLLLFVEFFADKIPGLDSIWDMLNSVIRIPAGAALAASVFGADSATMSMVAALLGGTLAASSQAAKTTTRAAINTSPEPFSNVGMSLVEDGLVVGAVWLATNEPLVFAVCLCFALLLMWLITWVLWRFLRSTIQKLRTLYQSFTGLV